MRFQIIMPVYNAQKYIEETLTSIANQKFEDYGVIMIDDGSTDNSASICKYFAEQYDNFRYIYSENKGVSSARNIGLRKVTADYILFIDADDILYPDTLEKWDKAISQKEKGFDIIFANYMEIYKDHIIENVYPFNPEELQNGDLNTCLKQMYAQNKMIGWSIWKQCYRTEVIKKNQIYFDETMAMAEDGNWLLNVITHSKTFYAIQDVVYGYRIFTDNSATSSYYSYDLFANSTKFYTSWYYYFKYDFDGDAKNPMMQRLAESYTNAVSSIHGMKKEDYMKAVCLLEQHKELLYNSKRKAHRMLSPILKIFGLKAYLWASWHSRKLKNAIR